MPVKPFELSEKGDIGEVPIENSNRIMWVESSDKMVSGLFDCLQMTWGNIPCDYSDCEIFHSPFK